MLHPTPKTVQGKAGDVVTVRLMLLNRSEEDPSHAPVINVGDLPEGWTIVERNDFGGTWRSATQEWFWWGLAPEEKVRPTLDVQIPEDAESGDYYLPASASDGNDQDDTAEVRFRVTPMGKGNGKGNGNDNPGNDNPGNGNGNDDPGNGGGNDNSGNGNGNDDSGNGNGGGNDDPGNDNPGNGGGNGDPGNGNGNDGPGNGNGNGNQGNGNQGNGNNNSNDVGPPLEVLRSLREPLEALLSRVR